MRSLDLSFKIIFIQWGNICVDWFMNLFADPDYYWIEETYPRNKTKTINYSQKNLSEKINRQYIKNIKIWDRFKLKLNMKEIHILKTTNFNIKSLIKLKLMPPLNITPNNLNKMIIKQQFLV